MEHQSSSPYQRYQNRPIKTGYAMRQSMDDVRNKRMLQSHQFNSSGHEQFGTLQFQKEFQLLNKKLVAPDEHKSNVFTGEGVLGGTTKLDYSTISTQKEANDAAEQRRRLAKFQKLRNRSS